MTWEDFDQLSSVYKFFGPFCSFPRQKWSALVNIRRKALLSSAGFRKRMMSLMYTFASIVHSDSSDDLTVCFEVLSCFFDHPSIDSTQKMLLHPFGKNVFMFCLDQAS